MLTIVEDLGVIKEGVGQFEPVFRRLRLSNSICTDAPKH